MPKLLSVDLAKIDTHTKDMKGILKFVLSNVWDSVQYLYTERIADAYLRAANAGALMEQQKKENV